MPRSWSLDTTLSNATGKPPNFVTGNDTLFFIESAAQQAVISWDGVSETDISGATWGGDDVVRDLCYFNSTLFAAVDTYDGGGGYGCGIYSYDGTGTSWTLEQTIQISGNDCLFDTGNNNNKWLVADGTRMVTVANDGSNTRLFASTDGSTWAEQTINGGTTYIPNFYLLGTQFTQLSAVLIIAQSGLTRRAIQYDTGVDWAFVGADIGSNGPILVGYADSKTFFANYTTGYLEYSSDYGASLTATSAGAEGAGASEGEPRVKYFAADAIMTYDHDGYQAYVWSNLSNDFNADGATGTDNIIGFFALAGELYAFCAGGKIYDGGPVSADPYELTHSAGGIPGAILEAAS